MTSEETTSTEREASVEHRAPEEAFGLLGNKTRVAILSALGESPEDPVTFSELRERVGSRDSGQFNYHLGKLTDNFVRKTEGGYELTMAGMRIVGALRAGTYTADVSIDPIELDERCPHCDGVLVAAYEDEYVHIRCRDCDGFSNQFPFPPGSIEQFDREDLPDAFDRWARTIIERTVAGFCPNCFGRLDAEVRPDEDHPDGAAVVFTCERCGEIARLTPDMLLQAHPACVAFFYDHGIDVKTTPTWEIEARGESSVELLETDPPRVRVEVVIDEERLVATIDSTATIESIEREPVESRD